MSPVSLSLPISTPTASTLVRPPRAAAAAEVPPTPATPHQERDFYIIVVVDNAGREPPGLY